ncbi:MAG TPA: glycoside hydrolase 43 family protein [Vicinamibacterales bacterium]|nr:glycoside hydrolase 43 family protein [Vicinamibacterales bacterium]
MTVSLPARRYGALFALAATLGLSAQSPTAPWLPDLGDGTFRNPVIFADYSDPDVARQGDDYYLVASSFNVTPALPILHSRDLVNWTIVGHAAPRLPSPRYDTPQHGQGVWAPSLRVHDGTFWIYFGDPDLGIFMTTATDPRGPWAPLALVADARGWIDPCPLWDDDGSMYLVHAWAKSRAGFNSVLTLRRLTADGRRLADDKAVTVFDGTTTQPTIEGPKFYKRGGYYYIFAPAGGVTNGWQTVLRSRSVGGPYEERIVMRQGRTAVNGPHQGGWIETPNGESWFVHFQDRGPYGRIVHLQPMTWRDDWPVIGADPDGDGVGEPVPVFRKPTVRDAGARTAPQATDEFNSERLGLQWQWEANEGEGWRSLTARPGFLRLFAQPLPDRNANLWSAPHLLMQKLPAESFEANASVRLETTSPGDAIALVTMGLDYALVRLVRTAGGWRLEHVVCTGAADSGAETIDATAIGARDTQLRLSVSAGTVEFSYSVDTGATFRPIGGRTALREGRWMGAKFGLVATRPIGSAAGGFADVDWVRVK